MTMDYEGLGIMDIYSISIWLAKHIQARDHQERKGYTEMYYPRCWAQRDDDGIGF